MNFTELETNVIKWARDRDLFTEADPLKQLNKTMEEYLETRDAYVELKTLSKLDHGGPMIRLMIKNTKEEIEDGIGDVLVTLIIFAKMTNNNCVDALLAAYNEIKDRKGKKVNGMFVKEE